ASFEGARRERGKLPDLTITSERIRRSAQRYALRELLRICPDLAAIGRRSQGEIAIDSEFQTGAARACGRCGKLAVRHPLEPHRDRRGSGGGRREAANGVAGEGPPSRGPGGDVDGAGLSGQGLIDPMLPQRATGARFVTLELSP